MTLFKTWLKDRESDETSSDAFDARMSALYADLSVRKSSDRLAFEAALEWWRHLLSDFCMSGVQSSVSAHNQQQPTALRKEKDRLTLRCDQRLLDDLTLEDVGRPIGIGTVLMEMQNTSCAHRLDQFLTNNKPVSGPTKRSRSISLRALSIAAMPLVWAFSQLSLNLGLNEHESDASESDWRKAQGEWVLWDSVEKLSSAILNCQASRSCLSPLDRIFSHASFKRELVLPALKSIIEDGGTSPPIVDISQRDLLILVKHLTRDRKSAVADDYCIKFKSSFGDISEDLTIGEHEREIVKVRETYQQLESQVEDIGARIEERQGRVESSLRSNSKNQALSYLRSRKALEALRDKRVGALETLHGILLKIEQAASDVEVVKAYEASTASLKALLKSEHLQPERIASSMDAMQESMTDAEEIRQAIELGQEGVQSAAGNGEINSEDLERELAALQEEVEKEEAQAAEPVGQAEPKTQVRASPVHPAQDRTTQHTSPSHDENERVGEERKAIAA